MSQKVYRYIGKVIMFAAMIYSLWAGFVETLPIPRFILFFLSAICFIWLCLECKDVFKIKYWQRKFGKEPKMKIELTAYEASIISGYLYSSLFIYRIAEHPQNKSLTDASVNMIKQFNKQIDEDNRQEILIKYEIEKALGNVL